MPKVLKILRGNPGRRPLTEKEADGVGALWAPPAWFNSKQREQWDYALEHAPAGLLTGTDREVLVIWCLACVEYAEAALHVRVEGQVVITSNGNPVQNPYLSVMNKQALIMLKAGAEMGFSPASRASLGARMSALASGNPGSGGLAGYLEQKPEDIAAD